MPQFRSFACKEICYLIIFKVKLFVAVIITVFQIVGYVIALLTLIKGVYEYGRQVSDKRAAQFLELRKIYRENQKFQNILDRLYGDQDFNSIPMSDRFEFLGFFEDIGFLLNSGKIRKEVVFYMFGYDIIHAWQSEKLWNDESKNTLFWSLLADLAQQMIAIEKTFVYSRNDIKL